MSTLARSECAAPWSWKRSRAHFSRGLAVPPSILAALALRFATLKDPFRGLARKIIRNMRATVSIENKSRLQRTRCMLVPFRLLFTRCTCPVPGEGVLDSGADAPPPDSLNFIVVVGVSSSREGKVVVANAPFPYHVSVLGCVAPRSSGALTSRFESRATTLSLTLPGVRVPGYTFLCTGTTGAGQQGMIPFKARVYNSLPRYENAVLSARSRLLGFRRSKRPKRGS